MKRLPWILVAVLVAGGLLAVRARRAHEKNSAPLVRRPNPVVEVVPARTGTVGSVRHVTGTLLATEEARLAPRIMARLLEVRVREGDAVSAGRVLAVLDARELEDAEAQADAALSAAREGVAAARAAWEAQKEATARDRILHGAGALSDEQWERSLAAQAAAAARLEAARAELRVAARRRNQARTRRSYAVLTAPFPGVVTARLADPGDLAVPGKPVLRVARRGAIRVRAKLPVRDLAALALGAPVTVRAAGETVETTVTRIVPATEASGLAAFEAELPDPPATFVPGATVGVDVKLASATGLVVPARALLEGGRGSWVFAVEADPAASGGPRQGTIRPVPVRVVARSAGDAVVEPADGSLAPGTPVVVARPSRLMTLAPGMDVEVLPATPEGEAP